MLAVAFGDRTGDSPRFLPVSLAREVVMTPRSKSSRTTVAVPRQSLWIAFNEPGRWRGRGRARPRLPDLRSPKRRSHRPAISTRIRQGRARFATRKTRQFGRSEHQGRAFVARDCSILRPANAPGKSRRRARIQSESGIKAQEIRHSAMIARSSSLDDSGGMLRRRYQVNDQPGVSGPCQPPQQRLRPLGACGCAPKSTSSVSNSDVSALPSLWFSLC